MTGVTVATVVEAADESLLHWRGIINDPLPIREWIRHLLTNGKPN